MHCKISADFRSYRVTLSREMTIEAMLWAPDEAISLAPIEAIATTLKAKD
ncbi:hypothetical protein EP7_002841 [Isosphaeraceae bacterium EP7]